MQAVKDKINEMGALRKVKAEARAEERVCILQHSTLKSNAHESYFWVTSPTAHLYKIWNHLYI